MINPTPVAVIVPDTFEAAEGGEIPFGKRWGGDVINLSSDHIAALQAGQTVALDVQNEYIIFLRSAAAEAKN